MVYRKKAFGHFREILPGENIRDPVQVIRLANQAEAEMTKPIARHSNNEPYNPMSHFDRDSGRYIGPMPRVANPTDGRRHDYAY